MASDPPSTESPALTAKRALRAAAVAIGIDDDYGHRLAATVDIPCSVRIGFITRWQPCRCSQQTVEISGRLFSPELSAVLSCSMFELSVFSKCYRHGLALGGREC